MDLKAFAALKDKVEALKAEKARAEGRLESLLARLKDEFGVDTVEDGRRLLAKLKKQADRATAEAGRALVAFNERWGEQLST